MNSTAIFPAHAVAMSLLGFLGIGSVGRADLIYFRKGGDAQIAGQDRGQPRFVSMPDGQVELSRDNVRKIIPGFWPEAEWPARRRKALAGGFEARFAAAWWAIENGLTRKRPTRCAQLHRARPEACADRANGGRSRSARPAVPRPGFERLSEGARYRGERRSRAARDLVAPASEAEASERIAMLEKVITGFLFALRRRGDRAGGPAPAAGLGLVCRQERLPGLSARGSGRRICDDARLFPPDLGRGGRIRRAEHRQSSAMRGSKLAARRDELHRFGRAVGHGTRSREDSDRAGRRAGSHGGPFRGEGGDRPARG